MQITLHCTSSY